MFSQTYIVTISVSYGYGESDYNVKNITVPENVTKAEVIEIFRKKAKNENCLGYSITAYNVYTLTEWLNYTEFDMEWENFKNEVKNNYEICEEIEKLREKINNMKNGKTNYYSDRKIEEWEEEIKRLREL